MGLRFVTYSNTVYLQFSKVIADIECGKMYFLKKVVRQIPAWEKHIIIETDENKINYTKGEHSYHFTHYNVHMPCTWH